MALTSNGRKTEHAGAKNGDKRGKRTDVKQAARKLRRRTDEHAELMAFVDEFSAAYPKVLARLALND